MRVAWSVLGLLSVLATVQAEQSTKRAGEDPMSPVLAPALAPALAPEQVVSGAHFLTEETRALQQDDFANPGMLWVEAGEAAFRRAPSGGPACAGCHTADGLRGAAATFPRLDPESGELLNLEGRINRCRERHQGAPALAFESAALLGLSAFVARQSQGLAHRVDVQGPAQAHFQQGRAEFFQRRGQLNLACAQCHNDLWGRRLRGDRLSQGHGNGFPAYRLEWQNLGSLHRRLQDCETGVRAEPSALGSQRYLALELYLAWRSQGLPLEAPGVRR